MNYDCFEKQHRRMRPDKTMSNHFEFDAIHLPKKFFLCEFEISFWLIPYKR